MHSGTPPSLTDCFKHFLERRSDVFHLPSVSGFHRKCICLSPPQIHKRCLMNQSFPPASLLIYRFLLENSCRLNKLVNLQLSFIWFIFLCSACHSYIHSGFYLLCKIYEENRRGSIQNHGERLINTSWENVFNFFN